MSARNESNVTPPDPTRPVCAVDGCGRDKLAAKGLCWLHYKRQRATGQVGSPTPRASQTPTCRIEGCDRDSHGDSLCFPHYLRVRNATRGGYEPDLVTPVRPFTHRPRRPYDLQRSDGRKGSAA